jgi:hypothetical protein
MQDRVELLLNRRWALILGLSSLVFAGWAAWEWWFYTYGTGDWRDRTGVRGPGGLIVVAVFAAGYGLWELGRSGDRTVQVAIDRDGITDFRLSAAPIPWADVARIDPAPKRAVNWGLVLMLRDGAPSPDRHRNRRDVFVETGRLSGGAGALRAAIARLAPQVPRFW